MARSQKAIHDLKHGKPEESVFYNGRLCKITVNERVKDEINGQPSIKIVKKPHPIYEKVEAMHSHYDAILNQGGGDSKPKNTMMQCLN